MLSLLAHTLYNTLCFYLEDNLETGKWEENIWAYCGYGGHKIYTLAAVEVFPGKYYF